MLATQFRAMVDSNRPPPEGSQHNAMVIQDVCPRCKSRKHKKMATFPTANRIVSVKTVGDSLSSASSNASSRMRLAASLIACCSNAFHFGGFAEVSASDSNGIGLYRQLC